MNLPVNGTITSNFGNRTHPIKGGVQFHSGVDISCPVGTPVKSMYGGKLNKTGNDGGGYGIYLSMINSSGKDTIEEFFGHLSGYNIPGTDRNKIYPPGTIVAKSGNTGSSTGPHLHYEIRVNGNAIDPLSYLSKNPTINSNLKTTNTTADNSKELFDNITKYTTKGFIFLVLISFLIFSGYKIYGGGN
jgi:murein DD-endopeptidase MepM/ murein hydrolase activator NlpD